MGLEDQSGNGSFAGRVGEKGILGKELHVQRHGRGKEDTDAPGMASNGLKTYV